MAILETQQIDEVIASTRRKMLTLGGAALAGLFVTSQAKAQTTTTAPSDNDVLNFALNLEYLEANFYSLATSGQTIDQLGVGITGTGTQGTVITKPGGPTACKVPFTNTLLQGFASEIAMDEQNHVNFLRTALATNAVAQPQIDLYNSFNTLWTAVLAFLYTDPVTKVLSIPAGTPLTFDPFTSDMNFLLGAYIFEVGVSAYTGAAPLLIENKPFLSAAAGIQAVEAYHYGLIRTLITQLDVSADESGNLITGFPTTVTTGVSGVRASLDGTGTTAAPRGDDLSTAPQKVLLNGAATTNTTTVNGTSLYNATAITNATISSVSLSLDSNNNTVLSGAGAMSGSLATARTPAQVLAIVTAGNAATGVGGFYPAGLNGYFGPTTTTTTAS